MVRGLVRFGTRDDPCLGVPSPCPRLDLDTPQPPSRTLIPDKNDPRSLPLLSDPVSRTKVYQGDEGSRVGPSDPGMTNRGDPTPPPSLLQGSRRPSSGGETDGVTGVETGRSNFDISVLSIVSVVTWVGVEGPCGGSRPGSDNG